MEQEDQILAYVQGRMTEADATVFEQEMAQNRALDVEVRALMQMRAEFAEDGVAETEDGWARLAAAINQEDLQPANTNRPLRFSLWQTGGLIAASLVLWQFVAVPLVTAPVDTGYQTVTDAAAGPAAQVLFVGTARISDVSTLLSETGGTIIDGPSAVGLYRIAFASETKRDAALERLNGQTGIVDMAAAE